VWFLTQTKSNQHTMIIWSNYTHILSSYLQIITNYLESDFRTCTKYVRWSYYHMIALLHKNKGLFIWEQSTSFCNQRKNRTMKIGFIQFDDKFNLRESCPTNTPRSKRSRQVIIIKTRNFCGWLPHAWCGGEKCGNISPYHFFIKR